MFELHTSAVDAFNTCRRMYRYRYVDRLVPVTESAKLSLGSGVHLALAAFYRPQIGQCGLLSRADLRKLGERALAVYDLWADDGRRRGLVQTEDDERNIYQLGRAMVQNYLNFALENDFFEVLHVEQRFSVPVWTPRLSKARRVRHEGTYDMVIRLPSGALAIMEHKTASSFPSETTLRLDLQGGFYLLAANQLFDEPIRTVVYNHIRKVDPARARTETVRRSNPILRGSIELDNLRRQLYYVYRQMRQERLFLPSPGLHCNWKCGYSMLCTTEQEGMPTAELLQEFYRPAVTETWAGRLDEYERRLSG